SRRTGLAAVLARGVAAGTIASNNGSASVAPRPRRNVRRGIAFLVIIIVISSFHLWQAAQERSAREGVLAPRGNGRFIGTCLTQIPGVCTKENRNVARPRAG